MKKSEETEVPEVHSEKCPVCNGFGTLKYGTIPCHACKKRGYILVPNKIDQIERKNAYAKQ